MNSLTLTCDCGRTFRIRPKHGGMKTRCKTCEKVISFPSAEVIERHLGREVPLAELNLLESKAPSHTGSQSKTGSRTASPEVVDDSGQRQSADTDKDSPQRIFEKLNTTANKSRSDNEIEVDTAVVIQSLKNNPKFSHLSESELRTHANNSVKLARTLLGKNKASVEKQNVPEKTELRESQKVENVDDTADKLAALWSVIMPNAPPLSTSQKLLGKDKAVAEVQVEATAENQKTIKQVSQVQSNLSNRNQQDTANKSRSDNKIEVETAAVIQILKNNPKFSHLSESELRTHANNSVKLARTLLGKNKAVAEVAASNAAAKKKSRSEKSENIFVWIFVIEILLMLFLPPLKLFGAIEWSWWWVMMPWIIAIGLFYGGRLYYDLYKNRK